MAVRSLSGGSLVAEMVTSQTDETTFAVITTPNTDGTLSRSAKTTVQYADWSLAIPNVLFVAGVPETLSVELDFVAKAN